LGKHFDRGACLKKGHSRNCRFVCCIGFGETVSITGDGAIFWGK
jgi:hypothetical protein